LTFTSALIRRLRARSWPTAAVAAVFLVLNPHRWPWIVLVVIVVVAANALVLWATQSTAKRLQLVARREHLAFIGSLSATSSTLTYTRHGKTVSIEWAEIKSIAYAEDPPLEQRQWLLRRWTAAVWPAEIPDCPENTQQLLACLDTYLPGFDSSACQQKVAKLFTKDKVVECWSRPDTATATPVQSERI
jgi:hypothetical protein